MRKIAKILSLILAVIFGITFAFRNVVIYAKNPREMLLSYNKEINNEITVKREEFGLEVDKND